MLEISDLTSLAKLKNAIIYSALEDLVFTDKELCQK